MARVASLWVLSRRPGPLAGSSLPPVGLPLQGFAEKEDAEAAQKKLERAAREHAPIGPFLKRLLTKGGADIAAAARAAGLPPLDLAAVGPEVRPVRTGNTTTYPKEYSEYCARVAQAVAAWWALVAADISPEANAALWDALYPNHTFYVLSRALFEP